MTTHTMGRTRPRPPRTRRKPLLFALTALAMVAASLTLTPASPAQAAEVTDGLALWYKLDETSGTVVKDSSGKNRHGTLNGAAGWTPGEGLAFNGTDTFVKLPNNVMTGLDSISVDMEVWVDPALTGPYWIYGLGNSGPEWGNGYLFAAGNPLRTIISTGNWEKEQRTTRNRNVPGATWKRVTYTQTGTEGILYEDGVEVARNRNVTIKPSAIGGGTTTANYLGKSLYRWDPLFKGKIRDFRVYDRAITATEVGELAVRVAQASVERDATALTLGDTSAVTENLKLRTRGKSRLSTITWSSSNPAVVAANGTVTRPPANTADATVTLTATVRQGAAQQTKTFTVKVPKDIDDSQKVTRATDALVVPNVADARGNLTLPTKGAHGTTITWWSADPKVISTEGVVTRPKDGERAVQLNLIATARINGASSSKTFQAVVPPLPPKQPLEGYLFSYFVGQNSADEEQIYFALSKGNEALKYRELNGGQPVLRSSFGDKGVRDPFIIRSPEGDKFYQIATDLRIFGNGDWNAAQRSGSKSIVVWESTDLVNWTDQRLVRVSADTAGNTWAPEAIYDEKLGAFVVFWASQLFDEDDPDHVEDSHNRVMYATTRDFHTFSEPKPYIEQNALGEKTAVIDTTMIKNNDTYYRYTKDEEGSSRQAKMIFQQKNNAVIGKAEDWQNIGADGSPVPRTASGGRQFQAEGPTIFKSNKEEKWYLLLDDFGGIGYRPFESTNLDSGSWVESKGAELPRRPRHGTVLPITQAEYKRLQRKYLPKELIDKVEPVTVRTTVGVDPTPKLPATVQATFADNSTAPLAVTWEKIDPTRYAAAGTFTVTGTLKDHPTVAATATVTVVPVDSANAGPDGSGAEGSAIPLTGTATGEGAVAWSIRPGEGVDSGATCKIDKPDAAVTTVSCTDDGSYEAELKVGAASDTAKVTVANAAPVIQGITATSPVEPGKEVALKATFTDAGSHDTHTCTVDWKDGSAVAAGTVADGACSATHTYADAGSYDAKVTVTDDDGATDNGSTKIDVAVPASVNAGPDVAGTEGAAIALAGSRTGTGAVAWSFKPGKGVDAGATCAFADAAALSTTITCTDDGTFEVTLTAGGLTDTAVLTLTNQAPKLGALRGPAQAQTGASIAFDTEASDPGKNDSVTCSFDWGDGTRTSGCSSSHTYRQAGRYTLTVTGRDDDGADATPATQVITVIVKPAANAGPDVTGVEGSAIKLAGSVAGPDKPAWTYRALSGVDTGATCKIADAAAAATTITCTDDGSYEVVLTAGKLTDRAVVTVTNAAPKITKIGGPGGPVKTGAAAGVTATFTDAGSHDTHTCTVDWKDGSTSTGTVKAGTCTASHTYRKAGSYDVAITVADDDGDTGKRTVKVVVKGTGAAAGGVTVPVVGTKLPVTGFSAIMVIVVGVAFLVLGGVLFRIGRSRRLRSTSIDD